VHRAVWHGDDVHRLAAWGQEILKVHPTIVMRMDAEPAPNFIAELRT
jgi:hypothetical protein